MSTIDPPFVRFLQEECSRLKDENQLMIDEVRALRRYMRALESLQETVRHFTPEQDILDLLDETLDCALALVDADDASVLLLDEETDELVFVLVHGTEEAALPGYRLDPDQGIAGRVVATGDPILVTNARDVPWFLPDVDEHFGFETRSLLAVPLAARGRVLGVIEVLNKRGGEDFTVEDASLLSILATLAASALDYAASVPERAGETEEAGEAHDQP